MNRKDRLMALVKVEALLWGLLLVLVAVLATCSD